MWQVKQIVLQCQPARFQKGDFNFGTLRLDLQICDKALNFVNAHHGVHAAYRTDRELLRHLRWNRKVKLLSFYVKMYTVLLFLHWGRIWWRKYFIFRGQYAVVKRCREKASQKEYAAKFVRKRRKGKDCRAEVWHEVEILSATNYPNQHPQIITLYDVFETRSEIILILELWVFRFCAENFI